MKIVIVDKNDNLVGMKNRDDLDYAKDIYRVSALWLTNTSGKILLAQRAQTKKHDPGMWGPAVAGTVEEGETYESNIVKEIEEELGVKDLSAQPSVKQFINDGHRYFVQWYLTQTDLDIGDFKIQKSEVAQIHWWETSEILKAFNSEPEKFIPSFANYVSTFLN